MTQSGPRDNAFISRVSISAELGIMMLFPKQIYSVMGSLGTIIDSLPKYAMLEEVLYRKGAEKWTLPEKARSCLTFGLVHIAMLVVPLAFAVMLILLGVVCMAAYSAGAYRRGSSLCLGHVPHGI
ncbi:MAG TPA: hypothetical protein VNG90_02320 [Candidatus Acidoferrum sp.]|nr:hypothetical protein [Candidatus Acidoferrum sp.]